MIFENGSKKVYLACGPTDLRNYEKQSVMRSDHNNPRFIRKFVTNRFP